MTASILLSLFTLGADACCGFVCCENEAVKCHQPPYLPEELNGIVSFDEYNQLCDEVCVFCAFRRFVDSLLAAESSLLSDRFPFVSLHACSFLSALFSHLCHILL